MNRGKKHRSNYQDLFGEDYGNIPKSVFAAIAVSFALRLTEKSPGMYHEDNALHKIFEEWRVLHANEIVQQKPIQRSKL
jgi:hypothetical protein